MTDKVCLHCMSPLQGENQVCSSCKNENHYDAPAHHLSAGTVLRNRYLVGKAIGEGGFGITYIGQDQVLKLRVAIKEYYPNGYSNRNHEASNQVTLSQTEEQEGWFSRGKERFLQEAQTLAQFYEEPGVVGVRDFFEENGTAYIVMDYLDGVTMKEYIRQNGPVPPEKLFALLDPVMVALEKIHAEGLIHRDISPDNLMLLKNGSVKLLDFGAVRDVTTDKSLSVVLKPGYAPEEQYRTKGQQGSWTDVYALCATMYKCITGITPDESLERAYEDGLKAPSVLGVSISPQQENVLLQGLRVRRSERLQNINALRQGLMTTDSEKPTHSIHIQRQPEVDDEKTVYQSPENDANPVPATAEEEKTIYQTTVAQTVPVESEKTVYQPQQPKEKVPTASEEKSVAAETKLPLPAEEPETPVVQETLPQAPRKKKRWPLIVGGVLAVPVLALALILAVVLAQKTGGPKEQITTIPGNSAYSVSLVGQIEDSDRSIDISYQSIQDAADNDNFLLLDYMGKSFSSEPYTYVKYLGYGLYAATSSAESEDATCPEINRVSLINNKGDVLIPGGACLIERPYDQDNTDSRYLLVYYATEKTDNEEECVVFLSSYGEVYTMPLSDGTMYKGYIRIYDLQNERFVPNIPQIASASAVRACGNSLVIGDYSERVMYDAEGNVLLTGEITAIGDGIVILYSGGTYRVHDDAGVQTYYANQYLGIVHGSQYITMDKNGLDMVMDRKGNIILDAVYSNVYEERGGIFCVENDGRYGLVTADGKELVPCRYESILEINDDYFGGNYYACRYHNDYSLVGENGIIATKLSSSPSGLAVVEDDKALILNKLSFDLELGERRYTELTSAMIEVGSEINGLYGVFDLHTGNQLLPYEYETVEYAAGYLYAYKNGSWEIYEISLSQ